MKKKFVMSALLVVFTLFLTSPLFAVATWDELVTQLGKSEKVSVDGREFLAELKSEAPKGSDLSLWKKLWVGEPRARVAAGVALMDKIFPSGDPGRWEEAGGFLSPSSLRPRQLAGLDAFFVTVAALDSVPGGEWTAAVFLRCFAKSGRGQVYFIEQMPADLKGHIDSIVAKTGLGGDWSVKVTCRPLPLLPVYSGVMRRGTAESRGLQYLDGAGRIASNGSYVWDRDKGYIYRIVEDSNHFRPLVN